MRNKLYRFTLSFFSAFLLWLAWPPGSGAPLILIAFAPLLLLEFSYTEIRVKFGAFKFLTWTFLTFLLWNIATTYWIYFAGKEGSFPAFFMNSLLMALIWLFYHKAHIWWGKTIGFICLFLGWLAFEYLHLNWDISWPWLTLGNCFASWPELIQWYEFTGHLGGSAWILAVNILIFQLFISARERFFVMDKFIKKQALIFNFIFIIPPFISLLMWFNWSPNALAPLTKAMLVQPNIDPYSEKFGTITPEKQLERMLLMAETKMDSSTQLVVFPETALVEPTEMNELKDAPSILSVENFMKRHPKTSVLIGADVYQVLQEGKNTITATARPYSQGIFVDHFNAALFLEQNIPIRFYAKSKLVPGVEKMPFPAIFGFLENYALDLGGTSGSLATQDSVTVFQTHVLPEIKAAPVICYESVYGGYCANYVRKGANLICIITNDGWWRDSPGYKQHLLYARMRAIENRRCVVRSANTGISAFINERGEILGNTQWWVPAVSIETVRLNNELTFYSQVGDFPGYLAALFLPLVVFIVIWKNRNLKPNDELGSSE